MWHDAAALNRLAGAILAAALLFALWTAGRAALDAAFPFRSLRIEGAGHAGTQQQARALRPTLAGGFFSMDLEATRDAFEQLPWVRAADVQRVWPDRLRVRLEEHRALAAWNDQACLNTHGEAFAVQPGAGLPRIYAPPGMERVSARQFLAFNREVAALGASIDTLVVTRRQSWGVRLAGAAPGAPSAEISVELGRDRTEERLRRFVAFYPQAVAAIGPIRRADMRYPNGFAVQRAHDAHRGPGGAPIVLTKDSHDA